MFDLAKLTEFNHALVYGFEPESSVARLEGSESYEDALYPTASQHQDMLEAYLYAQDTLLPQIKTVGLANITADMLLDWVKNIHKFIGKSLMQTANRQSGIYTDRIVLRWHLGMQLNSYFVSYMCEDKAKKSPTEFAKILEDQHGMDYKLALDFIALLEKIAKDETYEIDASLQPMLDYQHHAIKGLIVINKLSSAYHQNKLSAQEKMVVNKVVKICMFPPAIPAAMNQWAQDIASDIRACDPKDLNKVVSFLTKTFFTLTEIHPFPNGNGRTATCLTNVFLRAFGYPSIVLRQPGERSDKDSLYNKAFNEIDNTLLPLSELIRTRITEAQQEPIVNEALKKMIILRVVFSDVLKETKAKHPEFDLITCQLYIERLPEIANVLKSVPDPTLASTMVLQIGISTVINFRKQLDNVKETKQGSFFIPTFTEQDVAKIKQGFSILSQQEGWKVNSKRGMAWLEINDETAAERIISELNIFKIAKATIAYRVDAQNNTKIPVIRCENINPQKLLDKCLYFLKAQDNLLRKAA